MRELVAHLLFVSQALAELYNNWSPQAESMTLEEKYAKMEKLKDDLVLDLRRLELTTDWKSFTYCNEHASAAVDFYMAISQQHKYGSKPGTGEDWKLESRWHETRELVVGRLARATGPRWWNIGLRRKLDQKVIGPEIARLREAKRIEKELRRS